MDVVLATLVGAVVGATATAIIGPLVFASDEVNRHDRQISERDEGIEEWIVTHNRLLRQRYNEFDERATSAGVSQGGSLQAGRVAAQTLLLYDYRDELRDANNFVLMIDAEERWTHRLVRRLRRRPFPSLTVPARAEQLVDFWSEGTARNALTWSLDDILRELPQRATSKAAQEGA